MSVLRCICTLGCCIIISAGIAQRDHHIWVIGNTIDIAPKDPFWFHLNRELKAADVPVYLLFTGDLAGCVGERPDTMLFQPIFSIAQQFPNTKIGLLPGDRDWADSGEEGWKCIQLMEDYVEAKNLENIDWLIDDGCPGPDKENIGDNVTLLPLNTQWWNHPHRKPIPSDAMCDEISEDAIHEEVEDAISNRRDKNIIIAGHYPPYSTGSYNGYFPITRHLLPPVFGGMISAYHENIGSVKDITNERFEQFTRYIRELSLEYDNLIFLSSHEHLHEVINFESSYVLNSGAPLGGRFVRNNYLTRFTSLNPGFIKIYFKENGEVGYIFSQYAHEGFSNDEQKVLYQSPCEEYKGGHGITNQIKVPCMEEAFSNAEVNPTVLAKDSVNVIAGPQYKIGAFKKVLFGPHYRKDWTTSIKAPVLNLDSAYGGLEAIEVGGGRQTKSLKLKTPSGHHYVFRSVDKDPAGTLRYTLRNTVAATIARDQTSSQHPYGALPIARMLDELDLLHASPKLYVMPDDPKLGQFRSSFAGMLGMLEERPTNDDKGERPFNKADKIYKSHDLFHKLYDDPKVRLHKQEFARARMFDILVGDWSKHEDNWKWAAFDYKDSTLIRPIPRDRDHVFSNLDGFFPWLASREWAVPNLEPFKHKINSIRSLTYQARHMDRFLGKELTRQDWLNAATEVQNMLTEEEIKHAMKTLPPESYDISAEEITEKLLERRQDLQIYAERFYSLLAKLVDIPGTNQAEEFIITRQSDGSTWVRVHTKKDKKLIYQRQFLPKETKEIRLYGLHGKDNFIVEGQAKSAIKVRLIGGNGKDIYDDSSSIRKGNKTIFIYENDKNASISSNEEVKEVRSRKDELYHYDMQAFKYNTYSPIAYLTFNSFNGVQLKSAVSFTQHNFHHRDYSTKHDIGFEIGSLGSFTMGYNGEFHHLIHKWDLLLKGRWAQPGDYNYFFGIGNETIVDDERFDQDYYLVRHNQLSGNIGLRRKFWKYSYAKAIFGISENEVPLEPNTIVGDNPDLYGIGDLTLINSILTLEIDLRNHEVFPSRGYRFFVEQETGLGEGNTYGVLDSYLEYYLSPRPFPIVFGVRTGYSNSFGQVPFYLLPQLGQDQGLRGFQRNRFTGNGRVYINSGVRFPVAKFNNSFWPLDLGLRGFYDMGRIIGYKEANTGSWLSAYGGGFYITPLSRSYTLSVLIGASREENAVISFELGTKF